MKIALCITGQPRSFCKGYEYYYNNLLTKFDVDVFIHTWINDDLDKIRELYNPISMEIDSPLVLDISDKYTNTPNSKNWPPKYTISAYYSIFKCCMLKINHEIKTKQYDWVIKTRFDFALSSVIPFAMLEKHKIYMPPCRTKAFNDWLGNDQFAIGDSNIMNKYMSTYLNIDKYYSEGYQLIGEELLRANLIEYNIHNKIAYIDMPPPFPPGKYNGTPHFLIRDDYEKWIN